MKSFLNTLYEFCVEVGKWRAAASLARMGHYDEAKKLMTK
jgi:hypothetical protein